MTLRQISLILLLAFQATQVSFCADDKKTKRKKEASAVDSLFWTAGAVAMGYATYLTFKVANPKGIWFSLQNGGNMLAADNNHQRVIAKVNQHLPLVFWPVGALYCTYKALRSLESESD